MTESPTIEKPKRASKPRPIDWKQHFTPEQLKRIDVALRYIKSYQGKNQPNIDFAIIARFVALLEGEKL